MQLQQRLAGPAAGGRASAARPAFAAGVVAPLRRAQPQRAGRQSCSPVCQAAAAAAPAPAGDLLNKSYYPTRADAANSAKRWYIIDAEGQTLGRLATLAATYVRGKHQPTYSPSMDMGAYVVVINADKVVVTGNKAADKTYFRHVNGRPGSWRIESFNELQKRIPERIIERAVKGMLPKGRLGRDIRLHLKVFKGTAHPHAAQQPVDITKQISTRPSKVPAARPPVQQRDATPHVSLHRARMRAACSSVAAAGCGSGSSSRRAAASPARLQPARPSACAGILGGGARPRRRGGRCRSAAPGDAALPQPAQAQQPQPAGQPQQLQPEQQQQQQPQQQQPQQQAAAQEPEQGGAPPPWVHMQPPTPASAPQMLAWLPPPVVARLQALWVFLAASWALRPQFVAPSLPEALRRLVLVLAASLAMVVVISSIDSAWLYVYLATARRVPLAA
ncbi:RPL13 [Scenedesmus sp. PABB004]|nr:RPL13 [Scenedesmus sp. PABB004]